MNIKLLVAIIILSIVYVATGDQKIERHGIRQSLDVERLTYSELHHEIVQRQTNGGFAHKSLSTRNIVELDGLYDFCLDPNEQGFTEEWHKTKVLQNCNPENFYRMPVPSSFNEITSNNTVRNYVGWIWYQTTIRKDATQVTDVVDNQEWYIHFESINYMALVWATSQGDSNSSYFLGAHVGGYLPFSLQLPERLKSHDILLTIALSNRLTEETIPSGQMLNYSKAVGHDYYRFQPDFDFFHYSGIIGSVKLVKINSMHIEKVEWMSGCREIKYLICLSDSFDSSVRLEFTLKTTDNIIIYTSERRIASFCMSFHEKLTKDLQEFSWSPFKVPSQSNKFPKLLIANFILKSKERVVDEYELRVGLRCNFNLDIKDKGLEVSGRSRQLQGFGTHHEQYFSGRTMSRAAIMKDLYLIKDIGSNVIRTSHYPYSPEFLDACDEVGILVVAEVQAVGLKSFSDKKLLLHQTLISEMMQRDQHHPSILMWSIANEPQSQLPKAENYFKKLREYIDSSLSRFTISPNRPITAAIAQPSSLDKVGQFLDVIMINTYEAWYEHSGVLEAIELPLLDNLKGWSKKHKHKPLMISEFGADCVSGLHQNELGLFSEEYQRDLLLTHEKIFDKIFLNNSNPSSEINLFLGAMIWNFADFDTHNSVMRVGGNKKGVFTKDRQPKESVKYVKEVFRQRTEIGTGSQM